MTDKRQPVPDWADMIAERDAEIANLRATHSNLIGTNRMLKAQVAERDTEIAKLRAEVERARVREQELADEANRLLDEVKASDKKVFYLTAEVERKDAALNKALPWLDEVFRWHRDMQSSSLMVMGAQTALEVARAALNPSQEPRT